MEMIVNIFEFSCLPADTEIIYFSTSTGCHGRDRMVLGFKSTYTISAGYHQRCEFESRSWQGVLNTTLCDKVCQ